MAYIYQITNDINNKVYVGKTQSSIEKRFKEHCNEALRNKSENRPLHAAMRKHGIEHFNVSLIEETDNPDAREVYWIEEMGSFKNGYNAIQGGDGKAYADKELILALFNEGLMQNEIQSLTGYDKDTVRNALLSQGVTKEEFKERVFQRRFTKLVAKIDPNTDKILEVYHSVAEAERANGNSKHIGSVCMGKRKTCKGFKWKYL